MIACGNLRFVNEIVAPPFSPVEVQVLDICVRIAQFIGLPKSIGEIYGLLFLSPVPLPMDILAERLHLSKGSASQGLKYLRSYEAIIISYVAGDRRDHYVAQTDLMKLVGGFLRARIEPGIADLGERLQQIEEQAAHLSPSEKKLLQERLTKLRQWQRQAQKTFPLIATLLGK